MMAKERSQSKENSKEAANDQAKGLSNEKTKDTFSRIALQEM